MSDTTAEQRNKRLLSPESVNLPTATKLDKRQRHDSLLIFEDLPDTETTMDGKETPEPDLKSWMSRISAQMELAASKSDILGLATKQDLDKIDDRISAQSEEIEQIREKLDQYKKDIDAIRHSVDQAEAIKLNRFYETSDRIHIVVCQEFRSFGSVQGPSAAHLRMRVSPKWSIRPFGRVGKTVII